MKLFINKQTKYIMGNKGIKYWWKYSIIWELSYYWDLFLVWLKLKKPYTEEDFNNDMLEIYQRNHNIKFETIGEAEEFNKMIQQQRELTLPIEEIEEAEL